MPESRPTVQSIVRDKLCRGQLHPNVPMYGNAPSRGRTGSAAAQGPGHPRQIERGYVYLKDVRHRRHPQP